MEHKFSEDDALLRSDDELYALLKRLEPSVEEQVAERAEDGCYHAEDVAEALGISVNEVLRQLSELRKEHNEARLSGVLKELEEPLYRVERPSTTSEPRSDAVLRTRAARLLADRIEDRVNVPRRNKSTDAHELFGLELGRVVLYGVFGLCLLLVLIGILNVLASR